MSKPKYVDSPDFLWQKFIEYRQWVKQNPFEVEVVGGKDAKIVKMKKQRPMSIQGFEVFLCDLDIITDLRDYLHNRDGRYTDFEPVCRRIRASIASLQIEGAMAGIFHHNLVARVNGISEKTETEVKHVEQPLFSLDEPANKKLIG